MITEDYGINISTVVFWIAALFSIVDGYKKFEGLCCILLHKK
jgi:hypothetical protein